MTLILGIETSCDETAAAVVEDGWRVLSNIVASQHELHERFAGVVPEIASRAHLEKLGPTAQQALENARVRLDDLDAIAVGNRPGLIGCLLVGVSGAQALAWSASKPLIGVDHVEAHLHAAFLEKSIGEQTAAEKRYPLLGLVVSGGHTNLYEQTSATDLTCIGRTIDDAVGEAYDKAAVILKAGYPGGPALDRLAGHGDPTKHRLPRSLLGDNSLDFSFSGLKTALLYRVRGMPTGRGSGAVFQRSADDLGDRERADIAAAFQAAAIDVLMIKIERAVDRLSAEGRSPHSVVIGGGVSDNSLLRRRASEFAEQHGLPVRVPAPAYRLDNAAMIAGLAFAHHRTGRFATLDLPAVATVDG